MDKRYYANSKFRLNSSNYQTIDTDPAVTSRLQVVDQFKVLYETADRVHVLFTREVFFEPESFFELSVDFDIIFELDEMTEAFDAANLKAMLDDTSVVALASKLIGDITLLARGIPLITEGRLVYDVNENDPLS